MASRRGKTFKAGESVALMVRCAHMHLWVINGVVAVDGKTIECGPVSAANAPDDPTCCKQCGEPFAASYGAMRPVA